MGRLTVAAAVLGGALAACARADAEETITWLTDLDAARAEAKKDGKPMLAVFR